MSAAASGDLRPLLARVAAGHALSEAEAEAAFDIIMSGDATPSQMGALLMAPRHHSAMRHVAPTRVELGTRTIFNLLGPMSNPAGARRQLVGVFAPQWARPMAEVLGRLGAERAWVVHGAGMDELTTAGV